MQNIPRILFVDDHEDTRFMIQTWLARFNYEVATAENTASGLQMAQSQRFDIYVLDTYLSDGSGKDLCRRIREFDSTTPIIFYSGEAPERLRLELECGAQDYVLKPELDGLRKAIFRLTNAAQVSH
ncbi:MAG: response regulator [Pyrinomonadaceae bacterium]